MIAMPKQGQILTEIFLTCGIVDAKNGIYAHVANVVCKLLVELGAELQMHAF
jgi:hypothetical protein